ncbi:hypothetical protein GOB81_13535 [Acetobacter sp. LMG 1627]|uniref:RepB-like DNA primase domain-containing protein n=2 Tax=Acetobacter conturbans TaxID=1737472 RepID=A0ABX0K8A9_9PROT|nr:hypothetical protein [Acetobacter conturbans]
MSGYQFTIAPATHVIRMNNPEQTHDDFRGFILEMETHRIVWHDDKNAPGHVLWLPCRLNDCPEMGFPRAMNALAQPTHLFGLDFDDAGNTIANITTALDALGCDYYLHTTMSYVPGEKEKCRAVIHVTDSIMSNEENKMLYNALVPHFDRFGLVMDKSCTNIARKFYVPGSNRATGIECESWAVQNRGPLDNASSSPLMANEHKRIARENVLRQMEKSAKAKAIHGKIINPQRPYFNHSGDYNVADPKEVAAYIGAESQGSVMASFIAHMVGYCGTRFGDNVVDDRTLLDALTSWTGKTSHDNLIKNIRDARQKYKR